MIVIRTMTGSIYEYNKEKVRRVEFTHGMRRDGEWLKLLREPMKPTVGFPMLFILEPLGKGEWTERTTSPVTSILESAE